MKHILVFAFESIESNSCFDLLLIYSYFIFHKLQENYIYILFLLLDHYSNIHQQLVYPRN